MADHIKVVVYIRAGDVRDLRDQGIRDIPTWVRELVRKAIEQQQKERVKA